MTPNIGELNRNRLISAIIRAKYSVDDMEAVVNNYVSDPMDEEANAKFLAMNEWRKIAKIIAADAMEVIKENGLIDKDT